MGSEPMGYHNNPLTPYVLFLGLVVIIFFIVIVTKGGGYNG